MNKFYNTVFAIIFLLVLSSPMIRQMTLKNAKSLENRNLTLFPQTPLKFTELDTYPKNIEKYLSDNFGFRGLFINVSNKIYYHLFNELTSNKIINGKNGFIFLGSHDLNLKNSLIKTVCDVSTYTKAEFENTGFTYSNLINHFNTLGYITTIAIIPTKSRIYPENLPKTESNWCSKKLPTALDKLMLTMQNKSIYYPLNKFKQWKNEFQVYLPSFFHWHGQLPHKVALDIMDSLWGIQANIKPEPKDTKIRSDLWTSFFGLQFIDDSIEYDFIQSGVVTCYGFKCINGLNKFNSKNIEIFNFNKNSNSDLRLVIFSDSFGLNIAENFITGFDEVTLVRTRDPKYDENPEFINSILDSQKPTHLMFLFHDAGFFSKGQKFKKLLENYNYLSD